MSKEKFFVTTSIPYVNGVPHIGHALEAVQADMVARYHRLKGEDVYFLTGTDENSLKTVQTAEKENKTVEEAAKEYSAKFQLVWDGLSISYDQFIRTSENFHFRGAQKLWSACNPKDIYKKEYKGYYCVGCESFLTPKDLDENGNCPEHLKPPELVEEENYFFKLSKYQKKLKKLIESNEFLIIPETKKNEMISFIDQGLEDFSISRSVERSKGWGVPVPGDDSQIMYVWFDALSNYITALGYEKDETNFKKYWPADVHMIGKGINRFHSLYWPAMLLSAGIELPKRIYVHGYVTVEGQKIGKSLGNAIDPLDMVAKYGVETVRYFLLKEISAYNDGDFSEKRIGERYQSDLANDLGNLVSRVLSMTEKYFGKEVPKYNVDPDKLFEFDLQSDWKRYDHHMNLFQFDQAIEVILGNIRKCNSYIDEQKPWELANTDKDTLADVIYNLLETIRQTALMLRPVMPSISENILQQLGYDVEKELKKSFEELTKWAGLPLGQKINKGEILFPRLNQD